MMFLCKTVCKFPFFLFVRGIETPCQSGGGDSNTKVKGMLFVSLWGVNYRFWSHLGCLGWKVTIFAHSGIAWYYAYRNLQKKCPDTDHTEISLRGLSLNHQHCSPGEVNLNSPTPEHPRHFYMGVAPRCQ